MKRLISSTAECVLIFIHHEGPVGTDEVAMLIEHLEKYPARQNRGRRIASNGPRGTSTTPDTSDSTTSQPD